MSFILRNVLVAFAIFSAALDSAATGTLVSGPMLGYQAHRETLVWVETKDAGTVSLTFQVAGKPETSRVLTKTAPETSPAGTQPVKFVLPLLEMGTNYTYSLNIDGKPQAFPYPLTFKTLTFWEWRSPPPDTKFLYGSCAYLNDAPYDRPGTPYGKGTEIFGHMAASGADFMVWGGDNWYLREADYSSESGIWHRYSHDRATPELQRLYASMNHYAAWDDHDYGSDDANKSFELKEVTLKAFTTYWGNQTWGEADNPGTYGKFFQNDAAFFLMDNRWYRDDDAIDEKTNPLKTQYGLRQRDWLKQSLLSAQKLGHFRFKFIVTGGQVLTDFGGVSETFANYKNEREDLLRFIVDNKITGVVFLTGDVHFTELAKKKIGATQWAYELTSSPLSSGANTRARTERADEPHRVEGTFVDDQNYCVLALSGPPKERILTISCFDKTNKKRWERVIRAEELE